MKIKPDEGVAKARRETQGVRASRLMAMPMRRKLGMSAAVATLVAVGSCSALFVDYLAERARIRLANAPAAVEQTEAVAETAPAQPVRTAQADRPAAPEEPVVSTEGWVVSEANAAPVSDARLAAQAAPDDGALETAFAEESAADEDVFTAAIVPVPQKKPEAGEAGANTAAADASSKPARVARSVTMRSGPNKRAGAIATIPAKSQIGLIGCKSWCEVTFAGKRGFIYKSFVARS